VRPPNSHDRHEVDFPSGQAGPEFGGGGENIDYTKNDLYFQINSIEIVEFNSPNLLDIAISSGGDRAGPEGGVDHLSIRKITIDVTASQPRSESFKSWKFPVR
jgi:hypothetical protein